MRVITSFSVLFFLLWSCASDQDHQENEAKLLTAPDMPSETGYFNDHFEVAEIIQIQTNEDFLISDIKKMIRYKDKIILLSGANNSVFVIKASDGTILTGINKIGTGPGESKTIIDIAFDESSEQILIYNDYYKLLFFDMQGTFLSEIKVDGTFEGISWYDEEVFFHSKLEGYSCYPYLLKAFNQKDNVWKEIGDNRKVDFPIRSVGRQMVRSKHLWFTAPLDFNLFYFGGNQVSVPYHVSLPNAGLDERLVKESISNPQKFFEAVAGKQLNYAINSVRETTGYLIFRANQRGIFMMDKKENMLYWETSVKADKLGVELTNYYPHDGDDDKIMFVLPAETYIRQLEANPDRRTMALDVKEDDNPILVFYKQIGA